MRLGESAHNPTCQYHPRRVRRTVAQEESHHARLTNLLHGSAASETLLAARSKKNERVRGEIRGNALIAVEKRMAEMKAANEKRREDQGMVGDGSGESSRGKKRPNLKPAWEEGGLTKKPL
jgi:hypothetical protein